MISDGVNYKVNYVNLITLQSDQVINPRQCSNWKAIGFYHIVQNFAIFFLNNDETSVTQTYIRT